ncbi:hypothetical protein GCM10010309_67410 [Streptomyces violaceochromogenes]|nr:hypothetical protein GCM10010309_67410 [Streptomyces violaceochromogenes]
MSRRWRSRAEAGPSAPRKGRGELRDKPQTSRTRPATGSPGLGGAPPKQRSYSAETSNPSS